MKKSFGIISLVALIAASLSLHGCGEAAPKAEDSMESTFKQAKTDNPNAVAPAGKSTTIKAGDANTPAANNEGK